MASVHAAVSKKTPAAASKAGTKAKTGHSGAWIRAKGARGKVMAGIAKGGVTRRGVVRVAHVVPAKPSFGSLYGLHATDDPLDLASSAALVVDQDSNEVLFTKNAQAVLPIASLTKLMSALVIVNAQQSMDEAITLTAEDIDTEKGSRSRLAIGSSLMRSDLLHLALMASENRAAHALGRSYPGGLTAFVAAMNETAKTLGMQHTHFVEPTGLSSQNQSSARDLSLLVKAAYQHEAIRLLSVSPSHEVAIGERQMRFANTNRLVANPTWQIGLQKTGYIAEAGRCLVMQAQLAGRNLIMVLLDSAGKYSRLGDAERIRKWLSAMPGTPSAHVAAQPAT